MLVASDARGSASKHEFCIRIYDTFDLCVPCIPLSVLHGYQSKYVVASEVRRRHYTDVCKI